MKAIKITAANAAAIEQALRDVNGKATAHTYTSFEEIAELAERAEAQLIDLIDCKKHAAGAKFDAVSGSKVARSYKNVRIGTHVELVRNSAGWVLVAVRQCTLFAEGGRPGKLALTEKQTELAVAKLKKSFNTIKSAA